MNSRRYRILLILLIALWRPWASIVAASGQLLFNWCHSRGILLVILLVSWCWWVGISSSSHRRSVSQRSCQYRAFGCSHIYQAYTDLLHWVLMFDCSTMLDGSTFFLWRCNLLWAGVTCAHLQYLLVEFVSQLLYLIYRLSFSHGLVILCLFLISHHIRHQLWYFPTWYLLGGAWGDRLLFLLFRSRSFLILLWWLNHINLRDFFLDLIQLVLEVKRIWSLGTRARMHCRCMLYLIGLRVLQVALFQSSTSGHLRWWIDFFNTVCEILLYVFICSTICNLFDEGLYLSLLLLAVGICLLCSLSSLCTICLLVPQWFQIFWIWACGILLYQLEVHFAHCGSRVILFFRKSRLGNILLGS